MLNRLRFFTAGESHGQALTAILEGIPAGLAISEEEIAGELARRQRGYGRGGRMQIEQDRAQILSGVRYGKTMGSPVSFVLYNKDWPNWTTKMSVTPIESPVPPLQMPRPGHADFAGMVKYQQDDLRNILERSSARETTMRVALGAVAKKLLAEFGVQIYGHVIRIGNVKAHTAGLQWTSGQWKSTDRSILEKFFSRVEQSPVACGDPESEQAMMALIDQAKAAGDSLGGHFEVLAFGAPIGLGSVMHWDRKLDTKIAAAMMSINAMKAVEIGVGSEAGVRSGRETHDEIFYDSEIGYYRQTNHAGGVEGGMSNGEPIVVRVAMKPLPTLSSPLRSVDVRTLQSKEAFSERADVCAVPAAVVVGEAMLALVLADALCEKLGGDSIAEMKRNYQKLPHAPLAW